MTVSVGSGATTSVAAPAATLASERTGSARRWWHALLPGGEPTNPRELERAVVQLTAICLLLWSVEIVLLLSGQPLAPRWVLLLWPLAAVIYLGAGVLAWLRRPRNRMGALLVVGAVVWLGAGLVNVSVTPALSAAGLIVASLPLAIIVHLMLAFPSGALRGRLSFIAAGGAYFTSIVLQAPLYLFGAASPLQIASRPDISAVAMRTQWAVGAGVLTLTGVILIARRQRARDLGRELFTPLFLYGIFAALFVPASAQVQRDFLPDDSLQLAVAQVIVLAGIPIAFVVALLRGGFARTSGLTALGEWLGTHAPARGALPEVLADALGDHSIQVAFWVSEADGYFDHDGQPVTLPPPDSDRGVVEVSLGERHVGAISYDSTLLHDSAAVVRAGRIIAMALDNERLLVELRASRELLRASRARLVEATDRERRRVAQDIHDGVQARLVLLAIKAHAMRTDPAPGDALLRDGKDLEEGLQQAITELREHVHDVMPSLLSERGLYAAAEELTDRMPIPTEVRFGDGPVRLPRHVESTCYFVVAEALSNAVKHSRAQELKLTLEHDAGLLRIEVHDDGVGGVRAGVGIGLRGMADRIEALGGRLTIDSPPGRGTSVIVEVPCAP